MFGISKLWAAIGRLTTSINSLADTADLVNAGVRSQLQLESRSPHELPQAPALLPAIGATAATQPQARKAKATTAD